MTVGSLGTSTVGPAIIGFSFDFDVVGNSGASLGLDSWTLTAKKSDGRSSQLNGRNPKWLASDANDVLEFTTAKDRHGLYNPETNDGVKRKRGTKYTEAVFSAQIDNSVNLVEDLAETFSVSMRFGYLGSALEPITLTSYGSFNSNPGGGGGGGYMNPEPSSMLVWALGLVTVVGTKRGRRSRVSATNESSAS